MLKFTLAYIDKLEELHKDLAQAIDGLPLEAVDWVPGEGMNSIDVLITHLTGAERYWIGDVATNDPTPRDRTAEFRARGNSAEALRQRLDDILAYTRRALEPLALQDLEQERISQRDGHKFTVSWALLHAMEHAAIHLGHIQLTRQLWDENHGRIKT
jgi:uncharacterized damage-inducible protein DinB